MIYFISNLVYSSQIINKKIEMQTGIVKLWDKQKGYGFIISEDEQEYFVHARDLHISIKYNRLFEGQKVKFDTHYDMKGDKAINVKLIS